MPNWFDYTQVIDCPQCTPVHMMGKGLRGHASNCPLIPKFEPPRTVFTPTIPKLYCNECCTAPWDHGHRHDCSVLKAYEESETGKKFPAVDFVPMSYNVDGVIGTYPNGSPWIS